MTNEFSASTQQIHMRVRGLVVFAWLWVGVPFAYGVYELIQKVGALLGS